MLLASAGITTQIFVVGAGVGMAERRGYALADSYDASGVNEGDCGSSDIRAVSAAGQDEADDNAASKLTLPLSPLSEFTPRSLRLLFQFDYCCKGAA